MIAFQESWANDRGTEHDAGAEGGHSASANPGADSDGATAEGYPQYFRAIGAN